MISFKKISIILIAIITLGLVMSPVSASTQTITAYQNGAGNIQILSNVNIGGSDVTQTITAIQTGGSSSIPSYSYMMNYYKGPGPVTQKITYTGLGYFYKINKKVIV